MVEIFHFGHAKIENSFSLKEKQEKETGIGTTEEAWQISGTADTIPAQIQEYQSDGAQQKPITFNILGLSQTECIKHNI